MIAPRLNRDLSDERIARAFLRPVADLELLGLSLGYCNALERAGFETIGDVYSLPIEELRQVWRIGTTVIHVLGRVPLEEIEAIERAASAKIHQRAQELRQAALRSLRDSTAEDGSIHRSRYRRAAHHNHTKRPPRKLA